MLIQANKQHRKAPLTSANLETLPSAIQLDRALALLVRPNHGQALRLRVEVANAASQGPWLVMDGQPGVFYEFTISDAPAFSRSAYFHLRDDLDERINKGIGQLRIGVGLAGFGPGSTGKIRLEVKGSTLDLLCTAMGDGTYETRDEVPVVVRPR